MSLHDDILLWDKKSKQDILVIYAKYSDADDLFEKLLAIAVDMQCFEGATWLIKHALEHGMVLRHDQTTRLCALSEQAMPWQSVLHILQVLPFIIVPVEAKHSMMSFARIHTEHENKFVRA